MANKEQIQHIFLILVFNLIPILWKRLEIFAQPNTYSEAGKTVFQSFFEAFHHFQYTLFSISNQYFPETFKNNKICQFSNESLLKSNTFLRFVSLCITEYNEMAQPVFICHTIFRL
ncbi:hypothetical protein FGO68_gene11063 [Halteria grandinella]|uniref:Uncharacterized protein n=1 Tax=Halteria grandinella TaxID=5974 RepID=A0A8J8SVD2_HALGN|nr:hypothetical protein FGO68_gene11063 [Halteria grandinella]